MKFTIYEAKDGWRWRLRAENGRIVADGGEAFDSQGNAQRSIANIKFWLGTVDVRVEIEI